MSTAPAAVSPSPWVLYFDGACAPFNPGGHGTYGWLLYAPDGRLCEAGSGYLGYGDGQTNNIAEFAGLEAGLAYMLMEGIRGPLVCRGDSDLVVRQVMGVWACRKEHLAVRRDRCLELLDHVSPCWSLEWIPREQNAEADLLTQEALPPGTPAFQKPPRKVRGKPARGKKSRRRA